MAEPPRVQRPEWMKPFIEQKTRFAIFFGVMFAALLLLQGGFSMPALGGALIGGALFVILWVAAIHIIARRTRDRSDT